VSSGTLKTVPATAVKILTAVKAVKSVTNVTAVTFVTADDNVQLHWGVLQSFTTVKTVTTTVKLRRRALRRVGKHFLGQKRRKRH